MGSAPEISVVIPTYNRPQGCAALLRALADQTLAPTRFEVVVVDDCSAGDAVATLTALVDELPYRLQVLCTPANRGPAQARNIGWRAAGAPVLAFMDDDCTPEPGWLEAGLTFMSAHQRVGVAQGRTRAPDGVDVERLQGWYVWRIVNQATPYFDACNIFYRRRALEESGGFDEEIAWWSDPRRPGAVPVAWGEDSAAGWAVVEAGWDRDFVPDAVVVHEVELRGWWWHIKRAYLDRIIVGLAAQHPGYRREAFWRPWAYRQEDAAFLAALAGLVAAIRWRPAGLAVLPYLWIRRPSIRKPRFVRMCFQTVVVDAVRVVGQVSGALKYRTFVV
ncbi:MAG: glycosyltransferase [Actinomycetota bacterium]|nr:glycosyltransferase [Actinomycetota bacterium]